MNTFTRWIACIAIATSAFFGSAALVACLAGSTAEERLDSLEFEVSNAATTIREVGVIYSTARPELAAKLAAFAADLDAIAAAVAAVKGGASSGSVIDLIESAIAVASTQTWSKDPAVQADIAVGAALARAALRRAQRELAP